MKHIAFTWRTGILAAAGIQLLTASMALATEVTVWCWDPNFNGATMNEAAARYAKDHPDVKVNVVQMAKGDLEQKLQAQLASGTTEGLPDIVLIEDYFAQKYLQSFPGAFEPMNDKLDYSQFADYKVAIGSVDGKTYSLPFDSGVTGFFYRSDLLEQAGYKEADLQDITWDQYIDIAKAVKEKTGHAMQGLDTSDTGAINIMMQSAGSWYFNEDGTLNIKDNAVFKAVLTQYQKIMMAPEIWKPISGWSEFTGAFTSGDTASVITGVWITATIKAAPDMSGKWGVAPIPKLAGVDSATHASNQGGSSWYVLSSAPSKAAATDFLATVWGKDVDFYQKILIDQGAFATFLPARDGPAFKASDDFFGGQPVWQNFSTWLAAIPSVNYGIYVPEVGAAISAQLPGLAKGGSVDDAIAAIDAQVSQQIQ